MGIDVTEAMNRYGRGGASSYSGPPMLAMAINPAAIDALFAGIDGATRSAIRPATAAAARVIREKAKDNIQTMLDSRSGKQVLLNSMYMKFSKEKSVGWYRKEYHVSYNSNRQNGEVAYAPHGHLLEQGHWLPYEVAWDDFKQRWYTRIKPGKLREAMAFPRDSEGRLQIPKSRHAEFFVRAASPKWVAPRPFLRNAVIAARGAALGAAKDRLLDGLQNRVQQVDGRNIYTMPIGEKFVGKKDY